MNGPDFNYSLAGCLITGGVGLLVAVAIVWLIVRLVRGG